jgi:hypothetical protein
MPAPSSSRSTSKQVQPKNHLIFDPWQTASTGHQRPENDTYSGTRPWRETRQLKLAAQFAPPPPNQGQKNGMNGMNGMNAGRGKEWRWMTAQEARRMEMGVGDIRRYMGVTKSGSHVPDGKRRKCEADDEPEPEPEPWEMCSKEPLLSVMSAYEPNPPPIPTPPPNDTQHDQHEDSEPQPQEADPNPEGRKRGLFSTLTFYINGSTYPVISEHKLKRLLVAEGGSIALHLARREVTHVILPAPATVLAGAASSSTASASGIGGRRGRPGGVLSSGKLQKEGITSHGGRGGGRGIKYVTVEWFVVHTHISSPSFKFQVSGKY